MEVYQDDNARRGLVSAPFTVIAILLREAYGLFHKVLAPLAAHSPIQTLGGVGIATLLALVLIVAACFLAGLMTQLARMQRVMAWLDTKFLGYVPGYALIRTLLDDLSGHQADASMHSALAWIEEAWQPALVVEELENGWLAVFVPQVPNPFSGALYYLPPERVKRLDITSAKTLQCIERFGVGSRTLLKGRI